jgi:LmbE family N-acetylglucosaminyl deacetylase
MRENLAALLLRGAGSASHAPSPALDMKVRTLVFAPHPDDEVLGCGGTIALKVLAGAAVQVVIMTDGRTSHASFINAQTLVRMRHAEAIDASARLGLDASAYTFLDFEDNRLRDHATSAQQRVAEILARFDPEHVFVPHRHDRLPDHVATFDIVTSAVRAHDKSMTLFEYPVWLWNTWPWSANFPRGRSMLLGVPRLLRDVASLALGCRTRVDIRPVLQRKLDALAQYRSQVQRQQDDPRWPILSDVSEGSFIACFQTGTEIFRRTEHLV